jgi:hypothetical protein
MNVNKISQHNSEIYRTMSVKNLDKRHEEIRLEERRIAERLKHSEEQRIEMNRRMNRAGQNVDRMA